MMRKGFTLMELVVVVMILGILATIATPQFRKTMENSRATDSIGQLQAIALANRIYYNEKSGFASAQMNSSNPLITNRYLPDANWTNLSYTYYSCADGTGLGCCNGNNAVACAQRKAAPAAGGAGSPYSGWGYRISKTGQCVNFGGAPSCPG